VEKEHAIKENTKKIENSPALEIPESNGDSERNFKKIAEFCISPIGKCRNLHYNITRQSERESESSKSLVFSPRFD